MKYSLKLQTTNQWIGGFDVRRDQLAEELLRLEEVAEMWKSPIVATRVDRRGGKRGEEIIIRSRRTS